jgi:glycosyltransferase involved in cell wall biosynthesis
LLPKEDRLPLVIVGEGDSYKQQVISYARAHGLLPLLHFIRPDFDDFPALYQQADLFLYPSFYEGFGIPVLEALYSETPVITSNISSLPEAAGSSSYLVDPQQPEAIAEGIQTLLRDEALRARMVREGFAHASRFRGELLSAQLMQLYSSILD